MTLQEEMQKEKDRKEEEKRQQKLAKQEKFEKEMMDQCREAAKDGKLIMYFDEDLWDRKEFAKKYDMAYIYPTRIWKNYGGGTESNHESCIIFGFGKYPVKNHSYWQISASSTATNNFKIELWNIWSQTKVGNREETIYDEIRRFVKKNTSVNSEGNYTCSCNGCPGTISQWMAFAIFNDIEYVYECKNSNGYFLFHLE